MTTLEIFSYKPIIRIRQNSIQLAQLQLRCDNTHLSLLDALEAYKVQIEFQCRSGYCGTCRLLLVQGEVKYHHEPIAFINDREILPCCCLPLSDIDIEKIEL